MLKNYAIASALVAVMATPAFAQSSGDFRVDALQANSFEIQSSQIALQKSRNPAVRAFAKEAIRDHHAAAVALTGGGRDAVAGGIGGPIGGLIEAPLQVAAARSARPRVRRPVPSAVRSRVVRSAAFRAPVPVRRAARRREARLSISTPRRAPVSAVA